jgi:peptidoglycan/xylan/chitin deacetylase (PgdA/CDA1 family)
MMRALRSHLRDSAASLLRVSGATAPSRTLRGRFPIITFHRVLPEALRRDYPLAGLAVTPEELAWFLEFFGRTFHCTTLRDAIERWNDDPEASRPALAVTFDDGQVDNWDHARPVLDRLGVRASFFVPVDGIQDGEPLWHDRIALAVDRATALDPAGAARLAREYAPVGEAFDVDSHGMVVLAKALEPTERRRCVESWEGLAGRISRPSWDGFMSWEQLRTLAAAGHEIGSHSMSHEILPLCSVAEIQREVGESRRILESRLDVRVDSFCYPNGDCDPRCIDAVRNSGYQQAVTTAWGANRQGDAKFRLRRFDMHSEHSRNTRGDLSAARVAWRISGFHPGLR